MAGETELTIMGNLTADPELRTLGDGTPVASFTIASTPRTFNRNSNQWEDGQALFMRCSAWRDLANHCASSLSKGMRVIARGRLRQRSYTANDGSNRMVVELTVDEIGPSLRYATAQVTKSGQRQGFQGTYGDPRQAVAGDGGQAASGKALGSDPWSVPDDGGDGDEPEF
jgi:single-strand DNA-binding protein